MFDLEKAMADWRRQMLVAGIKTPVPLEELESHLREEIAQQRQSGLSAQQAFEIAAKKIGHASELQREFKRAGEPLETRLVKLMSLGCGAAAFLFALWTFLVLFTGGADWTAKLAGLAGVIAVVLAWRYNHNILPAIPNQPIRAAIGFACCIGSLLWIQYFITNFLPRLIVERWGLPRGLLIVEFLWSWTIMAFLGGVGHGLEKAARRQSSLAN